MKKRFLSLSLAILMAFSLLSVTAFAFNDDTAAEKQMFTHELSTNTVEMAINMDTASLANDGQPVDVDQWVILEDIRGTKYAYFVPLTGDDNDIAGYSVISFVGGTRTLVTATGNNAAILAKNIVNSVDSADAIIYEFPEAFIKKTGDLYQKICYDGICEEISDTSEYESTTVDFLSKNMAPSITPRVTIVYGSLDHWDSGQFVPVSENGGYYYGGYQGWLTDEGVSQFYADRSCGVTAASNMLYYMSQYVAGKSRLYTRYGITKTQFNKFQKDVYEYISPAIWGIPTLDTMVNGVQNFASSRGVSLSATLSNSDWNEMNVRSYIGNGLNKESPVLLLTWNSPIADLSMHWVTITRIYNSGAGTKLVTSNWAGQQTYDFATWVNGSSVYKGVIYFE